MQHSSYQAAAALESYVYAQESSVRFRDTVVKSDVNPNKP